MRTLEIPDRCANLDCPNKPGGGRFVLVESDNKIVGGHRYMRLWMCAPCVDGLAELINEALGG